MKLDLKNRNWFRWFWRISRLGIIFFLVHVTVIVTDGLTDDTRPADVALVLGNAVQDNGQPSPWLKTRVDRAADLYFDKKVKKIVVSGGTGPNGLPEGDYMKKYLVGRGIPDSNIIADNGGINTWHTAKNYDSISRVHGFKSVIAVSQFYHITRIKLALMKRGIRKVGSAHGTTYFPGKDAFGTFREFFAFYKYLVFY